MSEPEPVVELRGVTLHYGAHRVLANFDLQVVRGELVALLGPSGSGKTTVIRTIAGFLLPTAGSVIVSGRDVTNVPAHKRDIGVVFQNYALFPHMSVEDNIAYSMKVKRKSRAEVRRRCDELLQLVRLEGQGAKKPGRLSGGQQQRVALARALAMDPEVLLLDEPLSNLDANLRRDVGAEIRRLQKQTGTTAIMVTHDRGEAFGMADRIAVLRAGRIEQLGEPRDLYRNPTTRFMAEFVGEANLLDGTVERVGTTGTVITTKVGSLTSSSTAQVGDEVMVLIRPEDLRLSMYGEGDGSASGGLNSLTGIVKETFYYGSNVVVGVDVDGETLQLVSSGSSATTPQVGSSTRLNVAHGDCVVMPREGA